MRVRISNDSARVAQSSRHAFLLTRTTFPVTVFPHMALKSGTRFDPYGLGRQVLVKVIAPSLVGAAHAKGIIHRDLKPGNLLVTPDGRVLGDDAGA